MSDELFAELKTGKGDGEILAWIDGNAKHKRGIPPNWFSIPAAKGARPLVRFPMTISLLNLGRGFDFYQPDISGRRRRAPLPTGGSGEKGLS